MNGKPKMKVMKSKSSNSALVTRPDRKNNKKCRANAKFQPLDVKKRGVYVENKTTKSLDTHGADIEKTSPPPPRPGKKRFLTSVLSILSKDTTTPAGIHIPEVKKDRQKKVVIKERDKEDAFETEGAITEKISTTEVEEFRKRVQDKKKKKYRSKILNEYINADKFEVLQAKKNHMSTTPSVGSEFDREEINWIGFPRLVNDYSSEGREVSDLVKQISEGRKSKDKVLEKQPSTLVAEHKDDNKLYNFFVDILETTFSVYNVKAESSTASAASSNVALEIDESVAKKLRFKNIENQETLDDFTQKPSKPYYTVTDSRANWDVEPHFVETKPPKRREQQIRSALPQKRREGRSNSPQKRREARSISPQKKRFTSESYNYPKSRQLPPLSRSDVISQRSSVYKKNKKRDLLNMLREQLKMDDYYPDEPQNLYDALKVMARNKRKYQKSLRFSPTKNPEEMEDECMLRRRRIIGPSSSFKYPKPISIRQSEMGKIRRKTIDEESTDNDDEPSNHSIEVYGYDYDSPVTRRRYIPPKLKQLLLTYHSSDSDFDDDEYSTRKSLIRN